MDSSRSCWIRRARLRRREGSKLPATPPAALPAVVAVALTACNTQYPNSVFTRHTEFNREVGYLFDILIWLGTAVFIFVEALLLYAIFRAASANRRPTVCLSFG